MQLQTPKLAALHARAQQLNQQRELTEVEERELSDALDLLEEVGNLTGENALQPRARPAPGAPPPDDDGRGGLFGAPRGEARSFQGLVRVPASLKSLSGAIREAMLNPTERPRSFRNASMSEGIGEDGGFGVPPGWYGGLLDASLDIEQLRPLCNVIPMAGPQIEVPAFDLLTQTGGTRANLQLVWTEELTAQTDQSAKLRIMVIRAGKGRIPISVSNEAAADIPAFERRIANIMIGTLAAGLDYSILQGSGVGSPLGVLNSPCLITASKDSGPQTADTITASNITNMAARLHPACWRNAVWVISPSALAQVYALSQVAGPFAGGRAAMLSESGGTLTLLTRPVIVSDAANVLGDVGDITLCDFSKYMVGLRRDASIETSMHAGWSTDELKARLVVRIGGQPEWATPITLRDGTTTVSSFVALEAR